VTELDLLIQKAASGDEEAFGSLYDMNVDRIYKHIYYRTGNIKDAEDLTQKVFLKAWQAIGRYKITASPFLAWLMRISHNLIIDSYRRKKDEIYFDVEFCAADPSPSPEQAAEIDFDKQRLRGTILQLPVDQQHVILMRFIEGFTYAEIASSLGKGEGAIRVIQYRALKKLRHILEKEKDLR
jgi:RNA polymerase sigma-70 factor (ECF subfamily)